MRYEARISEGGNVTDKRRWVSLYVLCMGMLMIVLDATVVNVALPAIQDDLGFTQSGLAWVVNAYLISFGGLLLLSGRLGDLALELLPEGTCQLAVGLGGAADVNAAAATRDPTSR